MTKTWRNHKFEFSEAHEHPHAGAEIPAGWTIYNPYGDRVMWTAGESFEVARRELLIHLSDELREDLRVLSVMIKAME